MAYSITTRALLTEYWKSSKNLADSKRHLFRYLVIREGVRNVVYKDSKGYLTVGVGHRVVAADRLTFGQVISNNAILAFFNADFGRLSLDGWLDPFWWKIPNKIAVGSFIWTHGRGEYTGGQTERMLGNQSTAPQAVNAWVKANWDLNSPVNVSRNKADFQLWQEVYESGCGYFSASEHSSGNFYFNTWLQDSFFDKADMVAAYKASKGIDSPQAGNSAAAGCISGGIVLLGLGGWLLHLIFSL